MSKFYLQSKDRSYKGPEMLWWKNGCAGYTTNILDAHIFTREEAMHEHTRRKSDIPWPKEYIDQHFVVNKKGLRSFESLINTGNEL